MSVFYKIYFLTKHIFIVNESASAKEYASQRAKKHKERFLESTIVFMKESKSMSMRVSMSSSETMIISFLYIYIVVVRYRCATNTTHR